MNTEQNNINDFELITDRLINDYIAYMIINDKINLPFLQIGDKVAIKRKDYYDAKDMVLYKIENHYFIRRIIKKVDKAYFICGDGEKEIRFIEESFVVGKVISRERGAKRQSLLIKRKKHYLAHIMRKGKRLLNKSTVFDDQAMVNNTFEMAAKSKINSVLEVSKYKNKEFVPLDPRLEKELEGFKSPIDKIAEYEKKIFQKTSS